MIKESIEKIINNENLLQEDMEQVFTQIMQGEATPAQIGAFIVALRMKGETVDEITGAASVMRKFASKIEVFDDVILDTCGTGGDRKHTFNFSTMTALVASAAGITVAKHGNRSVSSNSGSADLLEQLGVNINAEIPIVEKCVNTIGLGFLFAPVFHAAMKHAIGPRREIGVRTIFNLLGPLTNPACASNQLLGVFDEALLKPIANVLKNLGSKHVLVVHGKDGCDEVSSIDETVVCQLKDEVIKTYTVTPEQFGIERAALESLQIDGAAQSAQIAREIISGQTGPIYDAIILNSAFAIYAADKAATIEEGLEIAKECLSSGKVNAKLENLIALTNENNS